MWEKVILKALQGQYGSAKQMRAELLDLMVDKKAADTLIKPNSAGQAAQKQQPRKDANANQPVTRQHYRKKKKKSGWMEIWLIAPRVRPFICLVIFNKFYKG